MLITNLPEKKDYPISNMRCNICSHSFFIEPHCEHLAKFYKLTAKRWEEIMQAETKKLKERLCTTQ